MPTLLAEALVEAALVGDNGKLRRLLGRGASADAVTSTGTTALYCAAVREDPGVVRLLLGAGADPNKESTGDGEGTPLCGAASWGYAEVIRELLKHGADPNQREDHGKGSRP